MVINKFKKINPALSRGVFPPKAGAPLEQNPAGRLSATIHPRSPAIGGTGYFGRCRINIPSLPGCYQFYDAKGKLLYIGKAANLKSRIVSYWQKAAAHTPAKSAMLKEIAEIKLIETESEIEALLLEANLIKKYQPPHNILLRDDKRFVYIKISMEDEIPGVFATRKITKTGKYFGPFVSAQAVRETLKAVRKIWPYCATRKPQKKPCFYYQINLCAGVCAGLIGRREYMEKIIKPIILFLEGKKVGIVKNYELRIMNYEKLIKKLKKQIHNSKFIVQDSEKNLEQLEEEAENLKYRLNNMKRVLEHANVLGVGEKYAADAVELAKVFELPKPPERIEGYDISNIFGREAAGAMAVFSSGEPDKNEYRKFKIKIGQGKANDVKMLREVLERRLRHSGLNSKLEIINPKQTRNSKFRKSKIENFYDWPLPDLIIVDGGKAQLNVASSILKKNKLNIPVIAISKREGLRSAAAADKLFFPGEKKPLELPLASPALHLIKRVRDEAHRFAIGYHRKLRKKKFLNA